MILHKVLPGFASLAMLVYSTAGFAQSDQGTTLAGGDNGHAAKMSETKKSGGMMKSNGGMMRSDGMKKQGAMKGGAMTDDSSGTAPMSGNMTNGK